MKDLHSSFNPPSTDPLNLDVNINTLRISNFRSIENCTINFSPNKIYFLQGHNGSGKSSLLSAIKFVFSPPGSLKKYRKKNSDGEVVISLDFEYNDSKYTLTRSETKSTLIKDSEDITPSYKVELTRQLLEMFPFIPSLNMFYLESSASFYNKLDVDSFCRMFNLNTSV